jgi:hypothetical protein
MDTIQFPKPTSDDIDVTIKEYTDFVCESVYTYYADAVKRVLNECKANAVPFADPLVTTLIEALKLNELETRLDLECMLYYTLEDKETVAEVVTYLTEVYIANINAINTNLKQLEDM